MNAPRTIVLLFIISVISFAAPAPMRAKKKGPSVWSLVTPNHGKVAPGQLRDFERRLSPFFRAKTDDKTHGTSFLTSPKPTQGDFFAIARYWNFLSAEFKSAYLSSTIIPSSMKTYISPRGLFEVSYAISGFDSVDRTDLYGYGTTNWRARESGANGVPDYIDEVAFAFDSAWSMEIDKFQFIQPPPFVDQTHPSNRFKVVVRELDGLYGAGTYGMTTPSGPAQGGAIGRKSYIELRSQWRDSSWFNADTSMHTDYLDHPAWGARVTAVHEFFHAVQFAMTRSYTGASDAFIDDFPITWLEGTGVLMEQLGFADIKDYLQYADGYFNDPTLDIFSGYNDVYTASLLAMYVYQHALAGPDIAFVKNMFFNDYRSPLSFGDDLLQCGRQAGLTFAGILGNFHTASFFSGDRSGPAVFLPDAPFLPKWRFALDAPDAGYSVKKNIDPYAMEIFAIARQPGDADVLHVDFLGDSISQSRSDTNPLWNFHCILQTTAPSADSIFEVPVSYSGQARTDINGWSHFNNALFIVSNAHGDTLHGASLVFEPCPMTMRKGDSAMHQGPIASPLSPASFVAATITAHEDLACSLSISSVSPSARQASIAAKNLLVAVNGCTSLRFPASWNKKALVRLIVREDALACASLENKYGVSSSAFSIFKWDDGLAAWIREGSVTGKGSQLEWQCAPAVAGVYCLFCQTQASFDSAAADSITVFPNPVRLGGGAALIVRGNALVRVLVYDCGGGLVYRTESNTPVGELSWPLAASGRPVAPGMYYAVIGNKDRVTKGLKQRNRKVVVAP